MARRKLLTEAEVYEARQRYAEGTRLKVLAKDYGVTPTTMGMAVRGRSYTKDHYRWGVRFGKYQDRPPVDIAFNHVPNRKLTADQVLEARRRRVSGETVTEIAQSYGVARGTMGKAICGHTFKWVDSVN